MLKIIYSLRGWNVSWRLQQHSGTKTYLAKSLGGWGLWLCLGQFQGLWQCQCLKGLSVTLRCLWKGQPAGKACATDKGVKLGIVLTFESITEAFMKPYMRLWWCNTSKVWSRNLVKVSRSKHSVRKSLALSTVNAVGFCFLLVWVPLMQGVKEFSAIVIFGSEWEKLWWPGVFSIWSTLSQCLLYCMCMVPVATYGLWLWYLQPCGPDMVVILTI